MGDCSRRPKKYPLVLWLCKVSRGRLPRNKNRSLSLEIVASTRTSTRSHYVCRHNSPRCLWSLAGQMRSCTATIGFHIQTGRVLERVLVEVLKENSKVALQYSPTEGLGVLKEQLIKLMEKSLIPRYLSCKNIMFSIFVFTYIEYLS